MKILAACVGALVCVASSNAMAATITIKADQSWRAISPVGNTERQDILTAGSAWETANAGWSSSLAYDDASWAPATEIDSTYIWGAGSDTPTYFRKIFNLSQLLSAATLDAGADDDAFIYINGNLVVRDISGTSSSYMLDIKPFLVAGTNLVAVKVQDSFGGNQLFRANLIMETTAVPEPATWAMMVGGFGLLGASLRRRSRSVVRYA
jgi:hypothetical protein